MRILLLLSLVALISGCCCCNPGGSGKPAVVDKIQMCEDVDDEGYGISCKNSFPYGINKVYVLVDYTAYDKYDYIYIKWYTGGELIYTDRYEYIDEEYGEDGYYVYSPLPYKGYSTLEKGGYHVEVLQDSAKISEIDFTIN